MPPDFLASIGLILRDVCLPIILVIALGRGFDRRFRLDLETLVKLNIYLFVPAFIFARVTQSKVGTETGLRIVGFTLLMIGSMAIMSLLVGRLRHYRVEQKKSLLLTTMFYNCGNFGIPLMTLAFPSEGPGIQVFVLMTMNVATFSIGLLLATAQSCPQRGLRWQFGPVLKQPSLYAIALAWLCQSADVPVQDWVMVWKPIEFLADALVGVALVTLGVQLSKTKPSRCSGPLTWALSIRLVGGPLLALFWVQVFGFPPIIAAILILGAAAPTAVNTALLAHEFKADSDAAAASVFYSTLLSFIPVGLILLVIRLG